MFPISQIQSFSGPRIGTKHKRSNKKERYVLINSADSLFLESEFSIALVLRV